MTKEEKAAFTRLVHKTHEEMGGRASASDVASHVLFLVPEDKRAAWLRKGCEAEVSSALRAVNPDTGLPLAPCIDGIYVQDQFLTEDEYAYLIAQHVKAAKAEGRRVRAYQEQCQVVHWRLARRQRLLRTVRRLVRP